MPRSSSRLLVVDGNPSDLKDLIGVLARDDYYIVTSTTRRESLELASTEEFDAAICDFRLEEDGALSLISDLQKSRPHLPVVITAANPGSQTAIEAIKAGAYDFLAKPVDPAELLKVIAEAIAATRRMSTAVEIGDLAGASDGADVMIGRSRAMLEVYKNLGRLSATPVTVLIRGETGTGKELIARSLYQHGHRAHRPFVTVNCAAIPENLLESELFGHEKGAFTGAVSTRIGKFEQAHNATLFLDEIGDLDLALQSKLLRVLQEKQIQRVGGRDDIPVDVRIIAATHRNLGRMVADREFREDLFYRLNVASIDLPPLRDRKEDVPLLTDFFLQRFGSELNVSRPAITTRAVRYLQDHPWPGNIRQLQNVIRKALLKCRSYAIDAPDLQEIIRDSEQGPFSVSGSGLTELALESLRRAQAGTIEAAYPEMVEKMERALLAEAIRLSDNNQARAARWLGISRLTLRNKLRKLGLLPVSNPRTG